jgi:hypothetical protein
MEQHIEEQVNERLEVEISEFLANLERKLPPDEYRKIMVIAAGLDDGDDE